MNIIFLTKRTNRATSLNLGHGWSVAVMITVLFVFPVLGVMAGYWLGATRQGEQVVSQELRAELQRQREHIDRVARQAEEDMKGLTVRLGQLQAQAVRLNALGRRLVEAGKLDKDEFDFGNLPAQGGPAADPAQVQQMTPPDFLEALDQLASELSRRESQLRVIESLYMNRDLLQEVRPAGRPIRSGWISSYYGMRTDPFTGLQEFHKGMDFAGKLGSDVVAVAGGVVTWAGDRYGYGLLVEISHGNGYITRYGHNKEVLVKVGDIVSSGQTIAHMGSSGRSTGPHVHYEVHYKGRVVDPRKYVVAKRR